MNNYDFMKIEISYKGVGAKMELGGQPENAIVDAIGFALAITLPIVANKLLNHIINNQINQLYNDSQSEGYFFKSNCRRPEVASKTPVCDDRQKP